jgi:Flp pilus assembly protein TadD
MLCRYQREYGDLKGVLSTVGKVFEENPNDLWVINEVAIEYADQEIKLEEALKLINKALMYQPENSIFIDTKGWILYKMGREEEAKLEIEKSLALNPDCKDTQEHYKVIMT